jgi:hypothetical protein
VLVSFGFPFFAPSRPARLYENLFGRLLFALLSGIIKVGELIVWPQNHHLPALLLEIAHISIAQFGSPIVAGRVGAFHEIEGAMSVEARHILAELVYVALDNDAGSRGFLILRDGESGQKDDCDEVAH